LAVIALSNAALSNAVLESMWSTGDAIVSSVYIVVAEVFRLELVGLLALELQLGEGGKRVNDKVIIISGISRL
jgi:hypothetical protein